MSLETLMSAALMAVCPRSYPDEAPVGTATPYVTWQQIGGPAVVYFEGNLPNKVGAFIQVNVWHESRNTANQLARQIEVALAADTTFQARPISGLIAANDAPGLRGTMQDFEVWAPRT